MKKLLIGLMLASGLLATDAQAGAINDKEETVEVLKNNYVEYIKFLCTIYIASIDAAIEDLENYLKYNNGSKNSVNNCIKLLKLYKSAFNDLLNRKSISTIQKTIRKVSGNFWLPPKEDANYIRYSRAIIMTLKTLPTPTTAKSTDSKYSSFIEDINKLFSNFKKLVSSYVVETSSATSSEEPAQTKTKKPTTTNPIGGNLGNGATSSAVAGSSSSSTSPASSGASKPTAATPVSPSVTTTSNKNLEKPATNNASSNGLTNSTTSKPAASTLAKPATPAISTKPASSTAVNTSSTPKPVTSYTSPSVSVQKPLTNSQKLLNKRK